jgi:hypothetical protein
LLLERARDSDGAESELLVNEAIELLDRAVRVNYEDTEAHVNIGNAYLVRAKRANNRFESASYFGHALQKFGEVRKKWPNRHEPVLMTAITLSEQALSEGDLNTKSVLFTNADSAFEESLVFNKENDRISTIRANYLTKYAKQVDDPFRNTLLQKAKAKYIESMADPDSYYLACNAALRGEIGECKRYLEQARATGKLPERAVLANDGDLANVQVEPWFKELLTCGGDGGSRPE